MTHELTLMAVHAHPDDEVLGTGGLLARSAAEGVRTVLVTCTNGEQGDDSGGVKPGEPGHDAEEVARRRLAELRESAALLDIGHVELSATATPAWTAGRPTTTRARSRTSRSTSRPRGWPG